MPRYIEFGEWLTGDMEMSDSTEREQRLSKVYSSRSTDDLEKTYDEWAGDYEEDVFTLGYTAPAVAAGFIGRHVPPGGTTLDAAVGTGALGDILRALDYGDLTGIDFSEGMMRRAREKGAYRELRRMTLGGPLDFPDDNFDACFSVGVFTEGPAPPEALDELARVVRPGGWMVFSVRADIYEKGGFREKQRALEEDGRWRLVRMSDAFTMFPAIETSHDGRIFVYQVS